MAGPEEEQIEEGRVVDDGDDDCGVNKAAAALVDGGGGGGGEEEEEEEVSPAVSEATQLPGWESEQGCVSGGGGGPSMGFPYFVQKKVSFPTQELVRWDRRHCRPSEEMDITRMLRATRASMPEAALEKDWTYYPGSASRQPRSESPPLQAFASGGQHSESSAAYVLWPPARINGTAEERAAYFNGLQKDAEMDTQQRVPSGQQASTLLDLMTIRAFHSKVLRRYSLGTALGFRTKGGVLTNIPAIIVFVARKVHKQWLLDVQKLPTALEGPGGVWCDVDVVEFSYYGAPSVTAKEQIYTEAVEELRGNDPCIGSGSQVASQETYGTLGAIVRSQTGARQVGFLTNRHVAVDLDYPNQKMFHPLPPNLGPGVYLGAVERATSFITDDLWYGIFAGMNPETFVRADGAFIPFADSFDTKRIRTTLKSVGELGEVFRVDLQAPIDSIVGQHVIKVGRSSGLTKGTIMAYAVEYNDEKGICFFTDFLIVGENKQAFDLEGDSGSLISMTWDGCDKPRPVGIIWGGTANRGRLKLRCGHGPENWTSGVDLGRLLDLLQLDLITTPAALQEALEEQRRWSSSIAVGSRLAAETTSGKEYPGIDMLMEEAMQHPAGLLEQPVSRPSGTSSKATAPGSTRGLDLRMRLPVMSGHHIDTGLTLARPPEGSSLQQQQQQQREEQQLQQQQREEQQLQHEEQHEQRQQQRQQQDRSPSDLDGGDAAAAYDDDDEQTGEIQGMFEEPCCEHRRTCSGWLRRIHALRRGGICGGAQVRRLRVPQEFPPARSGGGAELRLLPVQEAGFLGSAAARRRTGGGRGRRRGQPLHDAAAQHTGVDEEAVPDQVHARAEGEDAQLRRQAGLEDPEARRGRGAAIRQRGGRQAACTQGVDAQQQAYAGQEGVSGEQRRSSEHKS